MRETAISTSSIRANAGKPGPPRRSRGLRRWAPMFSNARYVFSRHDYEFYSKQTHEPFHREAYLDRCCRSSGGLADMVESDATVHREIEDGVWLEDAAGHSPGSCIVNARRTGSLAVFTGDAFHHPCSSCAQTCTCSPMRILYELPPSAGDCWTDMRTAIRFSSLHILRRSSRSRPAHRGSLPL
jgi:glyoxylase-like metal-dependent hydrolase (beta-lactamase superfamily II)